MRVTIIWTGLIVALTGIAGCAGKSTPVATSSSAATSASAAVDGSAEADKAACATMKQGREEMLEAVLRADVFLEDSGTGDVDAKEAATAIKSALGALREASRTASGQAADPELKAALTAYNKAAKQAIAALAAAGTDPAKIDAVSQMDALTDAERTIVKLCFNVNY